MKNVIRFLVSIAVVSLAGCVGYGFPGDYQSGYPGNSYPGNSGYPGNRHPSNNYGGRIRCESNDRRTRHCTINTRGGVQLERQLSKAACIQGSSWGYDSRGVWVSNGCRGEFVTGRGGYRPGPGTRPGVGGGHGQTVRCESNDRKTRRCNVSVRSGVQITRQLSRTRCVHGQNWGWDRSGIWVRGGCRAEFSVR
ncbi:DUF3011 domain-containing protein [Luteimonas lutimaris]|uniref:DUF3011 domain-containing protein n=1 Tax=Luteimonas lutimaris TaxID=698645 RepID=A0ABP7M8N0_9GAMM|nr:DUF3011 domain-containing protein [Luteimonas sp.]